MSKNHFWMVEVFSEGEWCPWDFEHNRSAARSLAKEVGRTYLYKTRVVKYMRAGK